MNTNLKQFFPILWEKTELLDKINADRYLSATFYKWTLEQQEYFIDCCTGVRGMKLLYDGFFKEIMNAEYTPERLDIIFLVSEAPATPPICFLDNINVSAV